MATITLNIPDAVISRVLDAIAAQYSYSATSGTKAAFAKKVVSNIVLNIVRDHEAQIAADAARVTASDKVTTDLVIT